MPELFVALADRRYRVERPWAVLPSGMAFGWICAVAVDSRDQLYVLQRHDPLVDEPGPAVSVFDSEGEYLGSWGDRLIKDAHHLFISRDDHVFLVDRDAHRIVICDTGGNPIATLGECDQPNRPFNHPASVAVAGNGDVYVADGYAAARVHRFDAKGRLLTTWGRLGRGPGEFSTPHGIWVLDDGDVVVGDRENNRVQIFDPAGRYLSELSGFYHPMSIYADSRQTIYVSDQVPRLTAISRDGASMSMCRPVLNWSHGIYGDSRGNLYLSESRPNRVTRLTPVSQQGTPDAD